MTEVVARMDEGIVGREIGGSGGDGLVWRLFLPIFMRWWSKSRLFCAKGACHRLCGGCEQLFNRIFMEMNGNMQ